MMNPVTVKFLFMGSALLSAILLGIILIPNILFISYSMNCSSCSPASPCCILPVKRMTSWESDTDTSFSYRSSPQACW